MDYLPRSAAHDAPTKLASPLEQNPNKNIRMKMGAPYYLAESRNVIKRLTVVDPIIAAMTTGERRALSLSDAIPRVILPQIAPTSYIVATLAV